MSKRVINFNPGPAALPLPVLEEIQEELLNYKGCGMSVLEISHRSDTFTSIIEDAEKRLRRLMGLNDDYTVLFLQGGASFQFAMIPMNLMHGDQVADYINTGTWSTKAIKEAQIQGKNVNVVASSEDKNFSYIPKDINFTRDAVYVHITSNNTIKGTQWAEFPDTGGVPIVSDMSSDILSRKIPVEKFGLIYAGAQKNLGPAGVTVVIIRKDLLELCADDLPTMLKYKTFAEKKSLFNTPPCFAIYVVQLVLKWLEETVGGVEKVEEINRQKAKILYDLIDSSDFYRGTAEPDSRSMMNVTFRLPTPELEAQFIEEAAANGLAGLKGHRSVGGCRASIYNATSLSAVQTLVDFMDSFAKKHR
ncbi:MAG: 3-phosphoserine/phosphohydroxythreonine transaminase [Deltaproteobacteria bacterium]|nr:MAG: 3-phosphoserine/phosphohydroxythreonine transaminase [Deltaproteobacteria bacterium]